MTESQRTPWIPVATPPVRDGVYEVRTREGILWKSLFRSGVWHGTCQACKTARGVEAFAKVWGPTKDHLTEWRGLAQDPSQ